MRIDGNGRLALEKTPLWIQFAPYLEMPEDAHVSVSRQKFRGFRLLTRDNPELPPMTRSEVCSENARHDEEWPTESDLAFDRSSITA